MSGCWLVGLVGLGIPGGENSMSQTVGIFREEREVLFGWGLGAGAVEREE